VITVLQYLVIAAAIGLVVFFVAVLVFGRGEQMAALPARTSPAELPDQAVAGSDIRGVRFAVGVRGYRMGDVDWTLDRVADEIERLRGEVRRLGGDPDQLDRDTDLLPEHLPAGLADDDARSDLPGRPLANTPVPPLLTKQPQSHSREQPFGDSDGDGGAVADVNASASASAGAGAGADADATIVRTEYHDDPVPRHS